jgi:hypothetical protein
MNIRILVNNLILVAVLTAACSRDRGIVLPVPESHPAHRFYAIASKGPTTIETCHSFGGVEIPPIKYATSESLGQGVFTIIEKPSGKKFLAVSWSQGGFISTINTCCWPLDK